KARLQAAIDKLSPLMESANKLYLQLSTSYLGFLTAQADWSDRFKGKTLLAYKAAVKDFADFSVRQKCANELLDKAKKLLKQGGIKQLQEGVEILTTRAVTITGDNLPLEQAKLFGGLVVKTEYKPDALLAAMSDLFDKTNQALAGIIAAFDGAKKN